MLSKLSSVCVKYIIHTDFIKKRIFISPRNIKLQKYGIFDAIYI